MNLKIPAVSPDWACLIVLGLYLESERACACLPRAKKACRTFPSALGRRPLFPPAFHCFSAPPRLSPCQTVFLVLCSRVLSCYKRDKRHSVCTEARRSKRKLLRGFLLLPKGVLLSKSWGRSLRIIMTMRRAACSPPFWTYVIISMHGTAGNQSCVFCVVAFPHSTF